MHPILMNALGNLLKRWSLVSWLACQSCSYLQWNHWQCRKSKWIRIRVRFTCTPHIRMWKSRVYLSINWTICALSPSNWSSPSRWPFPNCTWSRNTTSRARLWWCHCLAMVTANSNWVSQELEVKFADELTISKYFPRSQCYHENGTFRSGV